MTSYISSIISSRPSLLSNSLILISFLSFFFFWTVSCFKLYNAFSWFYLLLGNSQCSCNFFPVLNPKVLLTIHGSIVGPIFFFLSFFPHSILSYRFSDHFNEGWEVLRFWIALNLELSTKLRFDFFFSSRDWYFG